MPIDGPLMAIDGLMGLRWPSMNCDGISVRVSTNSNKNREKKNRDNQTKHRERKLLDEKLKQAGNGPPLKARMV